MRFISLALRPFMLWISLIPVTNADLSGLRFLLYTKSNKNIAVELKTSNVNTILNSPYQINKPTKILAHGYTANYLQVFPQSTKNAYLGLSTDYNVIAVDWSALCSILIPYETAYENVKAVGKEIANLTTTLISSGKAKLGDFHFAGHSLGGQIGAFISSNLPDGQKIPRITGLDPARPGYDPSTTPVSQRLDPTDADFVDVIRTSTGINGNTSQADPPGTGTVDFYCNGGITQPGCFGTQLCSHNRAYVYFTESITNNNFKAYKCSNYKDFQSSSCPKTNPAYMGEYASQSISGTYYLDTNAASPYAKG